MWLLCGDDGRSEVDDDNTWLLLFVQLRSLESL